MKNRSQKKIIEPISRYREDLRSGFLVPDEDQRGCVLSLNDLFHRLMESELRKQSFGRQIFDWRFTKLKYVKGLYIWGGVGRGKTYLVDSFFDCLPFEGKLRLHFHRFMHRVHESLKRNQGYKNPLQMVAAEFAEQAVVICFDEFFVSDIADAMILAELIESLFLKGVTLVATSNTVPDELYRDGLQRQRFLPAIACLYRYNDVLHIGGDIDYRYRSIEDTQSYYYPLGSAAEKGLANCFEQLSRGFEINQDKILVNGRDIPYLKLSKQAVWFDFETICGLGRSQNDYLFLAKEFHAVIVSNIRICDDADNDLARRLISLVDILYDYGVRVFVSAETRASDLYIGKKLEFEFDRTSSRLYEMQTRAYLLGHDLPKK